MNMEKINLQQIVDNKQCEDMDIIFKITMDNFEEKNSVFCLDLVIEFMSSFSYDDIALLSIKDTDPILVRVEHKKFSSIVRSRLTIQTLDLPLEYVELSLFRREGTRCIRQITCNLTAEDLKSKRQVTHDYDFKQISPLHRIFADFSDISIIESYCHTHDIQRYAINEIAHFDYFEYFNEEEKYVVDVFIFSHVFNFKRFLAQVRDSLLTLETKKVILLVEDFSCMKRALFEAYDQESSEIKKLSYVVDVILVKDSQTGAKISKLFPVSEIEMIVQ